MKYVNHTLVALSLIMLLLACSDFFEKDLSGNRIDLVAPSDEFVTETSAVTFTWDEENGVETYHLIVVTPGFDLINQVVLDTALAQNRFTATLLPSKRKYQWQVYGMNGASRTGSSLTWTFEVDTTASLGNQQVILSEPTNDFNTNNPVINFSWQSLSNADEYLLEIYRNVWKGELVHGPQVTTQDSAEVELGEGIYVWGVRALNDVSASPFSQRELIIDTTSPGVANLLTPAPGDTVRTEEYTFTWAHNDTSTARIYDSLYIARDTSFNEIISKYEVSEESYTVNLVNTGLEDREDYYWRIKTQDRAGNEGGFSGHRQFWINYEE